MLRVVTSPSYSVHHCLHVRTLHGAAVYLNAHKSSPVAADAADQAAARQWLKTFDANSLPRNLCEISFSRSSGPGGQNVNKVNSKAMLRMPLPHLLPLVPTILHDKLTASQYYAAKSNALVIHADSSRKQGDNVDACFAKLRTLILAAGEATVKGETSPEQVTRVKRLQKADNEARLRAKKHLSRKKSARRGPSRSDH
ncbi:MAG: hypothetical protein Q9220_004481 [cf. Caloplaca sp. 1 TL-2023]